MSMNDDSASRRGRRPEAGGQDWRSLNRDDRAEGWNQSSPREREPSGNYYGQRGRDENDPRPADPRRGAHSAYSKHSSYTPPRPEPAAPQQQARSFDAPPPPPQRSFDPAPQQRGFEPSPSPYQQNYYPEHEPQRPYSDQDYQAYPPQQRQPAEELEHPGLSYAQSEHDDLYGRQPAPQLYDQDLYGDRGDIYDRLPGHQPQTPAPSARQAGRTEGAGYPQREAASPIEDYERNFSGRNAAQEPEQASRFYLPEEAPPPPQRSAPQHFQDRGYAQSAYDNAHHEQQPAPAYMRESYAERGDARQAWADEPEFHEEDLHAAGLPEKSAHGDELDEDFFADEDDLDQEEAHYAPRKSRKKLMLVALAGAIGVGGAAAYAYKSYMGPGSAGDGARIIRADDRPSKEAPDDPGGRQFAHGEKSIYDRLPPDGQQVASMSMETPAMRPAAPPPPPAGNSLEERIDEALKKAQRSGDAPAPKPGPDQPTLVRGETYRPDGSRVDGARSMVTPSFGDASQGQLPPPFGNAPGGTPGAPYAQTPAAFRPAPPPPPAAAPQPAPQPRVASLAAAQPKAVTPAPGGGTGSGFYVQMKASQDEKAAQRELQTLSEKFGAVLGETQLTTKVVDRGNKGVWFKFVAGPLNTKDEASELCTKLKGAGLSGCFVWKQD